MKSRVRVVLDAAVGQSRSVFSKLSLFCIIFFLLFSSRLMMDEIRFYNLEQIKLTTSNKCDNL